MKINREIKLQVKRINNRLSDLINAYGEENEQVKRYISLLGQVSTYDPTKKYRIATPSKLSEDDIELINRADNLATLSVYTSHKLDEFLNLKSEEYKGQLQGKTRKEISSMKEFKEFVKESSEFSEFIKNNGQLIYNSSSNATDMLRQKGKKTLSRDDYNYISKLIKRIKENKNEVITDYDEKYQEGYNPFDDNQDNEDNQDEE